MKTNQKKLEEKIQNVIGNPFDSTHIMSVFQEHINSLLQEIEEKVGKSGIKDISGTTRCSCEYTLGGNLFGLCLRCAKIDLSSQDRERKRIRKALKTIKERYL